MKKIIILFLIVCTSLTAQNSRINYLSQNNFVMCKLSGGYVFGGEESNSLDSITSRKTVGINIGVKKENTIFIVDAGIPIFNFGYFNLGIGKMFSDNIYCAALLGVGYNTYLDLQHRNPYCASFGVEGGVIIGNINISSSYTMFTPDMANISLKIGYTFYDKYNYGNRKSHKYRTNN